MYIDDEEYNLVVFKNAFFRHYNIFTALSGEEGLKIMEEEDIHLIITDQKMPGMTGIEVLERVVETHPNVVRMILTAYSDIEIIMRAINKCGIYQYILKPWDSGELKLMIDNALGSYALTENNKRLLENLRQANEHLEKKVQSRTLELKIKNTQLQELNAVKDKLFSIISHDLKTPIASLSVLLEVFLNLKDRVSLDKMEKYGQKVQSYIRDVTDLLDNLLQWSITQIGQKKVSMTELDLKEILKKNIELFELVAEQKGIVFIKEWGPDEVYVKADEEMLNLVIRNLLNNAIKYTPSLGKVILGYETDQEQVEVRVQDTGVGISPAAQQNLFNFDKHDSTRGTAQEKGAGLGLSLCKEFIEKLGGEISATSQVGHGSDFRFTLDLVGSKVKI